MVLRVRSGGRIALGGIAAAVIVGRGAGGGRGVPMLWQVFVGELVHGGGATGDKCSVRRVHSSAAVRSPR